MRSKNLMSGYDPLDQDENCICQPSRSLYQLPVSRYQALDWTLSLVAGNW